MRIGKVTESGLGYYDKCIHAVIFCQSICLHVCTLQKKRNFEARNLGAKWLLDELYPGGHLLQFSMHHRIQMHNLQHSTEIHQKSETPRLAYF